MSVFSEDKLPTSFLNEIVARNELYYITIRSNVESPKDCSTWRREFGLLTNTNWTLRDSLPFSTRNVCIKKYECHHATNRAPPEKNKRPKFSKKFGCLAFIKFRVKKNTRATRKRDPFLKKGLVAIITIRDEHNHSLHAPEILRYLPATNLKDTFITYFKNGMTPKEAMIHHRELLRLRDDISELDMSNNRINPTYRIIVNWHYIWEEKNLNPKYTSKEEFVEYFKEGMSATEALMHHRELLELRDDISEDDMSNNRINPPNRTVHMWHWKWRHHKLRLKVRKDNAKPNVEDDTVKLTEDEKALEQMKLLEACKQMLYPKDTKVNDESNVEINLELCEDEKKKQSADCQGVRLQIKQENIDDITNQPMKNNKISHRRPLKRKHWVEKYWTLVDKLKSTMNTELTKNTIIHSPANIPIPKILSSVNNKPAKNVAANSSLPETLSSKNDEPTESISHSTTTNSSLPDVIIKEEIEIDDACEISQAVSRQDILNTLNLPLTMTTVAPNLLPNQPQHLQSLNPIN